MKTLHGWALSALLIPCGLPAAYAQTSPALSVSPAGDLTATSIALSAGTTQFSLAQRNGFTMLSVPTFRPTAQNSVIALDITPNGSPAAFGDMLAWLDIVDTDLTGGNPPFNSLHLSADSTAIEIGVQTYSSGAALKPLIFTMDGVTKGALDTSGRWSFGTGTARGKANVFGTVGQTALLVEGNGNGNLYIDNVGLGNNFMDGNTFHIRDTSKNDHFQFDMTHSELYIAKGTAFAPGGNNLALLVVAGTNAGTCKLQAVAGTSATPVTIVDNVGSGC